MLGVWKATKIMPLRGERLREARNKAGLTQDDLAVRTGVGKSQIQRYERGASDPTADYVARIAKALRISSDWLLGLVDDPEGHTTRNLTAFEERWLAALQRADESAIIELFAQRRAEIFAERLRSHIADGSIVIPPKGNPK